MKTLYLHIGPHKTGSTYIQQELFKHREKLFEQGVLYPDSMLEMYGHTGLATAVKSGDLSAYRQELNDVNSFAGDVILSSENFYNMTQDQISLLRQVLHFDDVKIIIYYRQPTIRLLSVWHEYVKSGITQSYPEFANRHLARPFISDELNIKRKIDDYLQVFSAASVHVVDYEKAVSSQSTLSSFFEAIGQSMPFLEKWTSVNARIDFLDLEVLRSLHYLSVAGPLRGHQLRIRFLAHRDKYLDLLACSVFPAMERAMDQYVVGASFVDRALLDTINKAYSGSVDESRPLSSEDVRIPKSLWLLDEDAATAMRFIYADLVAGA
ncbi:hypothetical protein ACQUQU_09675 [Thalassolituus sp. LLYu03]|uniref:hypothetical protein n=1 Tax=Thalassolituus sp. LLYu03 TaxID=3421656 RepID=UPI003D2E0BD2